MRRLYLILVVSIMLLAACGVAVTQAAVPAESSSRSYEADLARLVRQSALPNSIAQKLTAALPPVSIAADKSAPGVIALRGTGPTALVSEPEVRLPVFTDETGPMAQLRRNTPDSWTVLVDDDFQEANSGDWSLGEQEGAGGAEIAAGKLLITAQENWMIWSQSEAVGDLADGYITATFTIDGPGSAGVVARVESGSEGSSFYLCQINNSNVYACYKQQDGKWSDIIVGGMIINPRDTITMGLQIVGNELLLKINDVEYSFFKDDSLTVGQWGVFASADKGQTSAAFSHVQIAKAVSNKPTATATRTPRPGRATPTPDRDTLTRILKAVDTTNASESYDFKYTIDEDDPGPIVSEGQYVAEKKMHVVTSDPEQNEREAIIWGGEIFVKDDAGDYQLSSFEELGDDEVPAAHIIGRLADHPNVFEDLSDIMIGAYQIKDQGEVRLHGALTRHYTFAIDGIKLFDGFGAPFQVGTGEIYVDLSTGHVYALNIDTDFYKIFQAILIAGGGDRPPTPVPGTPVPEIHNIYNLDLWNFDAPAGFERPDVEPVE